MNIVFLDIDGVLNSMGWVIGYDKPFMNANYLLQFGANLDPSCVNILNRFVTQTFPSKIVLSSSWRSNSSEYELDKWRGGFEEHFGWKDFPIIDVTPRMNGERYQEIEAWLLDNPGVDDFVVIDDERDAWRENPSKNFHHTNMNSGLTNSIFFWHSLRESPSLLNMHFPNITSQMN